MQVVNHFVCKNKIGYFIKSQQIWRNVPKFYFNVIYSNDESNLVHELPLLTNNFLPGHLRFNLLSIFDYISVVFVHEVSLLE